MFSLLDQNTPMLFPRYSFSCFSFLRERSLCICKGAEASWEGYLCHVLIYRHSYELAMTDDDSKEEQSAQSMVTDIKNW